MSTSICSTSNNVEQFVHMKECLISYAFTSSYNIHSTLTETVLVMMLLVEVETHNILLRDVSENFFFQQRLKRHF